jgi:crotonobetainyl-CoA:carnitine CoA-transferase CaiB-like acyl-CoA transferase
MTRPMLEGLRVLAVSQFGAGPFGTQLLSDLGAEVIKIEDLGVGGDISRQVGPWAADGDSLYFQSFNRGKKSITLDLTDPDGQTVLRDLARVSHAVFNNLRGDLPARLGLTYAALKDVNAALVCCSLSGFGATGPRAAEPAFDYLIQGYAGWMSVTGEPDGPPGKCGVSVVDFAGGYVAMAGLMAALWDAQRTGVGRDLDIALLDTAVSMLSYFAIWQLNRDWQPARVADSGHQSLVPAQNFRTADGWLVVFCNKEKFWQALVEAMELPEVARDPRFATFADRATHKAALLPILAARFGERTTGDWLARLRGRVPCAPVNTVAEALEDEQVRAREMIVEVKHPTFGLLREVASPVKTAGTPAPSRAPALGEHTEEILRHLLRYDPARIATLRASGALGRLRTLLAALLLAAMPLTAADAWSGASLEERIARRQNAVLDTLTTRLAAVLVTARTADDLLGIATIGPTFGQGQVQFWHERYGHGGDWDDPTDARFREIVARAASGDMNALRDFISGIHVKTGPGGATADNFALTDYYRRELASKAGITDPSGLFEPTPPGYRPEDLGNLLLSGNGYAKFKTWDDVYLLHTYAMLIGDGLTAWYDTASSKAVGGAPAWNLAYPISKAYRQPGELRAPDTMRGSLAAAYWDTLARIERQRAWEAEAARSSVGGGAGDGGR